jgi:hypothetical protein
MFDSHTQKAVDKYHTLLQTEDFFVGPGKKDTTALVTNTKKWAEDISYWGKKPGTKEVVIDSVALLNKFGFNYIAVNTRQPLNVKVDFTVRSRVKEPCFGVAIFREDGVYCYGPNTFFDGYVLPELKVGKGRFILKYRSLLLAPGKYKISIGVWDKRISLPFDYHVGCYKFTVTGRKRQNGFLNMPFEFYPGRNDFLQKKGYPYIEQFLTKEYFDQKIESEGFKFESIKLFGRFNEEKATFKTNEMVQIVVSLSYAAKKERDFYLWAGLYRDDGICCQDLMKRLDQNSKNEVRTFRWVFQKLPLLPGGYTISTGIWDNKLKKCLSFNHRMADFNMVFNREDHGTVYLDHTWDLRLGR